MGVHQTRKNVAYGLSQSLLDVPYAPIVSTRVPATTDLAAKGTIWVTTADDTVRVCTNLTGGAATWTQISN